MTKWTKIFAVGAAAALITASAAVTSFAADPLPLCGLSSCNETGEHIHYGSIHYAGHYMGDGHKYHEACDQSGCVQTGVHTHDGNCYYGHSTAFKSSVTNTSGRGCGGGGHHSGGHHGSGHY